MLFGKKISLTGMFLLCMVVTTTVSIIVVGYLWLSVEKKRFAQDSRKLQDEYFQSRKDIIKYEVDCVIDFINYKKNQGLGSLKRKIKNRTYEAHAIATHIYNQNKNTKTIPEIQMMVKEALRPIRFNHGRGYYFAGDFKAVAQLFADKPEFEGQDLSAVRDGNGKYVIRDMIAIVKNQEEGYYSYLWSKPASDRLNFPKLAFVKHFEPFGWFLGTGEYLDDLHSEIQSQVLERIETIRFGNDGYIFVGHWDGEIRAGPAKGRNMWDVTDSEGVYIVRELIAAAIAGGGFVRYVIPKFEGQKSAPKISYARGVGDWQWYVGAGLYIDEIDAVLNQKQAQLKNQIWRQGLNIILILLVLLVVICGAVKFISNKIRNSMASFVDFFSEAFTEKKPIDEHRLFFSEFFKLARSANRMMAERNQAEADLRKWARIFEYTQTGIVVVGADDLVLEMINPAFGRMHGYDPAELVAKSMDTVVTPDSQTELAKLARVDHTKGIYTFESQHVRKDGSLFPVMVSVTAVADERGNTLYRVMNVEDITAQKLVGEERENLERQLVQAQKMEAIGVLAGGIAHDFNNILFPMLGYLEMLIEDTTAGTALHDSLTEILKGGNRAKELVKQILAFSRQSDRELKPLKISLVVKEALKLIRASLPSTIEIRENIHADCGFVMADPTQIHQIVMNLTTNAYHALQPDGGTLDVALETVEGVTGEPEPGVDPAPGVYVCLTVVDSGSGMDKQTLDRIFDPYFTTKEKGKGTGLGLAVVHGIIKSYRGHIRVHSQPDRGTRVRVYLPVKVTHIQPLDQAARTSMPVGTERVLLVDDEDQIVNMQHQMLVRLGYRVTSQTSSVDALQTFKETPDGFDLVITDMTMPNLTGLQFARRLMEIRPEIPIILCTGFSEQITEKRVKSMGIQGFIMKPVVISELARVIRKVLDR